MIKTVLRYVAIFAVWYLNVSICIYASDTNTSEEINVGVSQLLKKINTLKGKDPNEVILLGNILISELDNNTNGHKKIRVDVYNQLAHANLLIGNYSKSFRKAKDAKSLAEEIGYDLGLGIALKNIANFYLLLDNYEVALDNYLKALEFRRKTGDNLEVARALNNIAQVYSKIGKNDESISVFLESIEILDKIDSKKFKAYALGGMADAYSNKGENDVALKYASQAMILLKNSGDIAGLINVNILIGEFYFESGNYLKAKQYFNESLKLAEESEALAMISRPYINLAKVALFEDDFEVADSYAKRALKVSSERKELGLEGESLELLSEIYEAQGDLVLALKFFKQQRKIEKRIFNLNSDRNLAALRTSFEVDKLGRQNQLLKQQNEIIRANIEKQKAQQYFIIIFFLFVIFIIAFAYYRFTQTKKLYHEKLINEQLQRVNEIKDQILMNTSHEFRTPIAGMIGLADCLREELMGPQTDEAKENLLLIANSGKRLTSLVDDIINFAQLKSGDFEISAKPVDVHRLVEDVVISCKPLLNDDPVTINSTLLAGQFIALADDRRLVQILFNLVGNAIKYSDRGEIKIVAEQTEQQIIISISDHGIGIPQDKLGIIFEYFEQIDASASRTRQGSGLGLAITKRLVELQGGSIWVESVVEKGSVFSFSLPGAIDKNIQHNKIL